MVDFIGFALLDSILKSCDGHLFHVPQGGPKPFWGAIVWARERVLGELFSVTSRHMEGARFDWTENTKGLGCFKVRSIDPIPE